MKTFYFSIFAVCYPHLVVLLCYHIDSITHFFKTISLCNSFYHHFFYWLAAVLYLPRRSWNSTTVEN